MPFSSMSQSTTPDQLPPYHQSQTVEDMVQQNINTIIDLDKAARAQRTVTDRLMDAITAFCGSLAFVWVHLGWFGFWIGDNQIRGSAGFDPYPYPLLTLIVSLEAILLSTFILISQNRDAQLSERRNQLDLQINLLTEQENTKMLTMLKQIADKVGADVSQDPTLAVLEQATQPEKLVEQIERTIDTTEERQTPAKP